MGQRHQIYVRLPKKFYNAGNPNNEDAKTIGVHHQWLYGKTAVDMLAQFMVFCGKQDAKYNPFTSRLSDVQALLNFLYSGIASVGYFHKVHDLDSECDDPTCGDNNDGITVIDFEKSDGPFPAYCFVNIGHLEGEFYDEKIHKKLKPMKASEYLSAYQKDGHTLCNTLDKMPVITQERLAEIFPRMFKNVTSNLIDHLLTELECLETV